MFDKAPPAIDEALRARVGKFYGAFIAGKFKDAYSLVADDSQDKFFELSKDQYKRCEIIKINYSENFTKAAVVTSCKSDWRWHGHGYSHYVPSYQQLGGHRRAVVLALREAYHGA